MNRRYQILGGLQLVDISTTWFILHNWSARAEGNPLAAFLFHQVGINIGLLILLVVKLGAVYGLWKKQSKVKLITAIYGVVIFNNLLFLGLWLLN